MKREMDDDIREVLERAKNGEKEAFSRVYTEYYSPIYKYLFVRTHNKELTEDLTQDVFLKAYKSLSSFKSTGSSPLAYFYTIARNTLIDFRRKRNIDTVTDEDIFERIKDTSHDAEKNPEDAAIHSEDSRKIHEYIHKLTEEQREIITLKFMNGLENKEIAEITGKTEAAIRQMQVRALRTLSVYFKQSEE
jgi:RNA polymerase sigma-70 factor (ECF subfamily)